MEPIKKYTQANRIAWNEAMPFHQKANQSKWDDAFSQSGYSVITTPELELLTSLGLDEKRVAHVCCNNGVELMSIKNMGAGRCVGFDISDVAILEAKSRAEKFGIECEFVQTDVYDIPDQFNSQFDLVYISIGCLGWLPDITTFFQKISMLLGDAGTLFIYESHPFAEMLPADDMVDVDPLTIVEPYFKSEPYVELDGIDYVGKTSYKSEPQYWFVWTMSDIITGIIKNDMRLTHFSEYREDISTMHRRNEARKADIPLSYILMAEKVESVN